MEECVEDPISQPITQAPPDGFSVQIFNQFNARKIKDEYNIFAGIWKSQMFIYVAAIILAFQVSLFHTAYQCFLLFSRGWPCDSLCSEGEKRD